MEDFIVKYISKHGSQGMYDGIENAEDTPYEWAGSRFDNFSKMPKDKKGKVANALQGLFAAHKVSNKRFDEVEAERDILAKENISLVSRLNNLQLNDTLLKMEKVQLQKDMGTLTTDKNILQSTVEKLSDDLQEVKTAYHYIMKTSVHKDSPVSNWVCDTSSNNTESEECWEKRSDLQESQSQHSSATVKYPMAPIHSTTVRTGASGEEVMSHTVKCLNPSELESVVKGVGRFQPGTHDPLEFLTSLENCVNIYRLTDFDSCVVLCMCLPSTLSRALSDKVKTRMANAQERKKTFLEVLGIVSVNPEKLAEVTMKKGEHPVAFADRLMDAFKTYSGFPDITTEDVVFKSALITKCDPQTRAAIDMFVTHVSEYSAIIYKMTQFYNNQTNAKKPHPVAAIESKFSQQRNVWKNEGYRPRERENTHRPPPYNPDEPIVCYSCNKEGHIARDCWANVRRTGPRPSPYSEVNKKLSDMQAAMDKLSKENGELRVALTKPDPKSVSFSP